MAMEGMEGGRGRCGGERKSVMIVNDHDFIHYRHTK